jgi:hypothetical protein
MDNAVVIPRSRGSGMVATFGQYDDIQPKTVAAVGEDPISASSSIKVLLGLLSHRRPIAPGQRRTGELPVRRLLERNRGWRAGAWVEAGATTH